jgi:hypothetical protein
MPPSVGKRGRRQRQKPRVISPSVLFHEPKLCLLINSYVFSQWTPLMYSAHYGFLETCRVLVASKADVAAWNRSRSPLRARNLPLTPCVAATAKLHSNAPSTTTQLVTQKLLHTFAASARRNDAAPPTVSAPCFLLASSPPPAAIRSGCGRWVLARALQLQRAAQGVKCGGLN